MESAFLPWHAIGPEVFDALDCFVLRARGHAGEGRRAGAAGP
jgi:hypothetical protein